MIYFRLARDLGGMTVREMLKRIDSIELARWIKFYEWEDEEIRKAQSRQRPAGGVKRGEVNLRGT